MPTVRFAAMALVVIALALLQIALFASPGAAQVEPARKNGPTSTSTPQRTISLQATSTPTPVPCLNSGPISGSILLTDPVQTGRMNRDGVSSLCDAPKTCSLLVDTNPRHYDTYTFVNPYNIPSCFTVSLDAGTCIGANYIFSTAYLGSYNPASLCNNYLADIGMSPNPRSTYSFTVPARATFVVVVHETDPNAGCAAYTLTVTNCPPSTCAIQFSDVPSTSSFYAPIRCLACRNIVSGYSDGTFRPNAEVTRGQLAKIVSNAAGFTESPDPQIYQDVPASDTFYQWINRLSRRGFIGGYPCGGPGEPCVANRPYFRPNASATRAQTAKIVSNTAGYTETQTAQTFQDVPPSNSFYQFIQRLASRGIMGGYPCGGPGEPCVANRPYFRPNNNITRGQSAKIVANTFFPGCNP
ncbi:MAG TPA: S-layer homology domain-containing protein [Chloroflexia bacterium]|nr:S-layer homology domain-containing protein [Chloroflexia bacterium]